MKNRLNSGKVAFCGIMAALSFVILLLTVIPVTEISLAALAGIVGIPVVMETGRRNGLICYAAVSLLSLLLIPTLEGKVLYIAFFGYYPVLKSWVEGRAFARVPEYIIKLAFFNAAMIGSYFIMLRFFSLDSDSFTLFGVSLPWVFLLIGNAVMLLYDWCLTRLIGLYCTRFRSRIRRLFHF